MQNNFYKILFSCLIVIIINVHSTAQQDTKPQMADLMYSNGKIYVVVGVLAIVLIGIIIYLFALDRKLTAIEKKIKIK